MICTYQVWKTEATFRGIHFTTAFLILFLTICTEHNRSRYVEAPFRENPYTIVMEGNFIGTHKTIAQLCCNIY